MALFVPLGRNRGYDGEQSDDLAGSGPIAPHLSTPDTPKGAEKAVQSAGSTVWWRGNDRDN